MTSQQTERVPHRLDLIDLEAKIFDVRCANQLLAEHLAEDLTPDGDKLTVPQWNGEALIFLASVARDKSEALFNCFHGLNVGQGGGL